MLVSKIEYNYGFTTTELNAACWKCQVRPIYMHSEHFVGLHDGLIYKVINDGTGPKFVEMPIIRYSDHKIPVYAIKNDLTGKFDKVRYDQIYLETFYGPMPKEAYRYSKSYIFDKSKIEDLKYRTNQIIQRDENTLLIYGVEFRRAINIGLNHEFYVSEYGVVYDNYRDIYMRRHFDGKLYIWLHLDNHIYKMIKLHRLVYIVWNNNNELIGKDTIIDHSDGYKNHCWASNLRKVTSLENYRNAGYKQNLRTTPWTYEIIHFMCRRISENPEIGAAAMQKEIKKEFPNFSVSYGAMKHKVRELKEGKSWRDVAALYNILPNYKLSP